MALAFCDIEVRAALTEQPGYEKEMLLWPKKDVGANVGVSGQPNRHRGSVGNA